MSQDRLKQTARFPCSSCLALTAFTHQQFNPRSAGLWSPVSLSHAWEATGSGENRKAVGQRWLCRRLLTRAGEEARPPWPRSRRHSLTQRGRSSSCHFQAQPAWEQVPPGESHVQFFLRGGSASGREPAVIPRVRTGPAGGHWASSKRRAEIWRCFPGAPESPCFGLFTWE